MGKETLTKYINIINRYHQIIINHELKPYGLGSGQYFFLLNIYENQGISQKELSNLVKTDKATTAKALKRLEEENYIYRVVDEVDKRYHKLFTTEKGVSFIPKLIEILNKGTKMMSNGMSEEQYKETLIAMRLVLNNVQAAVAELRTEEEF